MSTQSDVLQNFQSKPFVQKVVQECCTATPRDVLSCFFGVDYTRPDELEHYMEQGHIMDSMKSLWFGAPNADYDKLCKSTQQLVEKAAGGELPRDPWYTTVEGRMALMLLCDQFPRNIYRGTEQAFQYDAAALEHAQVLATEYLDRTTGELKGHFYPPYIAFMGLPFIHSEQLEDHARALSVLDHSRQHIPQRLHSWWDMQRRGEVAHKAVIERFGRYPHRNRAKGRTNTKAEEAWLADVDNLPSWAKSQL